MVTAIAGVTLLLSGCGHQVTGSAVAATRAVRLLPTDGEVTSAVGNGLSTFGFHAFVGGPEILPDGFRTDADATPIACVGVTDTTVRVVYETTPMLEAARQSYFTLSQHAAVTGADAAVVRMASAADAERVFDDSVRRWRGCDGTTVDKRLRGVSNAEVFADIADVSAAGHMLSATLRTRPGPNGPTSLYQRALGVRGDTLVEVSLAVSPEGAPDARAHATAVADDMLDKV